MKASLMVWAFILVTELISRRPPSFFFTRNQEFRYEPWPSSRTPRSIRWRKISMTFSLSVFGIGIKGACQALWSTTLITYGGVIFRSTTPYLEKSHVSVCSRAKSMYVSRSNSVRRILFLQVSRISYSFSGFRRVPFSMSENFRMISPSKRPVG